jgi:hypothetical protein
VWKKFGSTSFGEATRNWPFNDFMTPIAYTAPGPS